MATFQFRQQTRAGENLEPHRAHFKTSQCIKQRIQISEIR